MFLLGPVVWFCSVVAAYVRARRQGYHPGLFTAIAVLMGLAGSLLTLMATRDRVMRKEDARLLRIEVRTLSMLSSCGQTLALQRETQVARLRTLLGRAYPWLVSDLDRAHQRPQRLPLFADSMVAYLDAENAARVGSTGGVMMLATGYLFLKGVAVLTLAPSQGWSLADLLTKPAITLTGIFVEGVIAFCLLPWLQGAWQYRIPILGSLWMDIDFARFTAAIDLGAASGLSPVDAYRHGLQRTPQWWVRLLASGRMSNRLKLRLRWLLLGLTEQRDHDGYLRLFRDSAFQFTSAARVILLWRWSLVTCFVLPFVAFLVTIGPLHPG